MPEDAPTWMLCEDMITRLKEELILEAIDILHDELKAGRVDISGYVALLPDRSDELQKDMYIIGNFVQRQSEIEEQYRPLIENAANEKDPERVAAIERLGKFLLSVRAISTLMRLSEIAGDWAGSTGKYSRYADRKEILSRGMVEDGARCELVDFVLSSRKFISSKALTDDEIAILRQARPST